MVAFDTIAKEVLVHHEFQTTDSKSPIPQRMADYIGPTIEQHGLAIYSTVIYLRPDTGHTGPGYTWTRPSRRITGRSCYFKRFRVQIRNMTEAEAT